MNRLQVIKELCGKSEKWTFFSEEALNQHCNSEKEDIQWLVKQLEEAREALEFYGDDKHNSHEHYDTERISSEPGMTWLRGGKKARKFLEKWK